MKKIIYRLGIYWTPIGDPGEGGMEDERYIDLPEKPTSRTMDLIERLVREALKASGRLKK
jgi:hypothetical protein